MVLSKLIKEKVVKKKLRVADVFYPQKSLGQESEWLSVSNAVSIFPGVMALSPITRG